jgi:hypothetical protein
MIGLIIKNWRLIIDILLVIGLVLAFTFWDPFDIFQQSKLKQTANLVTRVRDIGQLVTAEYYGEVISSWKEFKLNEYPEDTITQHAGELFTELKNNLSKASSKSRIDVKDIPEKYKTLYHKFIAFLGMHYFSGKKLNKLYDDKKQKSLRERLTLRELWSEGEEWKKRIDRDNAKDVGEKADALQDYLDSIPSYLSGFYNFYASLVTQDLTAGKLKKKNIVFIGRGWVKAGFDFGRFDESNFLYEKSLKTVHIYGLKAVILDQDINPWFIPQQKVKGFELVDFSSDVNFNDAKEVKADCKRKLGEQAGTELLKQAQTNGKEALKNFFSLLLNEPNLLVEFHNSPYDHVLEWVGLDSLISLQEAAEVDSIYKKEISRISRIQSVDQKEKNFQQLVRFIENVKKMHFYKPEYAFNYYSLSVAAILRDSFHMQPTDFATLLTLRDEIRVKPDNHKVLTTAIVENDSGWFHSGDFMREFNTTLGMLMNEVMVVPGMTTREVVVDSLIDLQYDAGYLNIDLEKLNLSDSIKLDSLVKAFQKKVVVNEVIKDHAEREKKAIQIVLRNRLEVGPLTRFRRKLLEVSNNIRSR